jgi:hypothetical protein
MDTVELIAPREDLEASHRTFVEEFRTKGEGVVPWVADFLLTLLGQAKINNLDVPGNDVF